MCWRLSADLASRGHRVRLWVDDASALLWMAPHGHSGVQVHAWPSEPSAYGDGADVVIEAFGCELPESVQARIAAQSQSPQTAPIWINLEYLSAEPYVERQHGLPSPVLSGPAQGCTKWFFFPGFTERTGGLLRETDLLDRRSHWDPQPWLHQRWPGLHPQGRKVSLFCYEPAGLVPLLQQWASRPQPMDLLVTAGRTERAMDQALAALGWDTATPAHLQIHRLPWLTQTEYDHLLWSCDLNFVRGEDSLVRALWAGQPFIWNIYAQSDDAHHPKLQAFLDWLQAPAAWRAAHLAWNGIGPASMPDPMEHWADWQAHWRTQRLHSVAQPDLLTRLWDWMGPLVRR